MEKGRELLAKTVLPISEIDLVGGYEDIPYFTHVFHKAYGMSPLEFRKKYSLFYNME